MTVNLDAPIPVTCAGRPQPTRSQRRAFCQARKCGLVSYSYRINDPRESVPDFYRTLIVAGGIWIFIALHWLPPFNSHMTLQFAVTLVAAVVVALYCQRPTNSRRLLLLVAVSPMATVPLGSPISGVERYHAINRPAIWLWRSAHHDGHRPVNASSISHL
jgi:hypothetical protein